MHVDIPCSIARKRRAGSSECRSAARDSFEQANRLSDILRQSYEEYLTLTSYDKLPIRQLVGQVWLARLTLDERMLEKISAILKKYPENRITVIGHTDSTGSNSTNQALSESRASSVKSIMVANGVPAQHVQVVGAGESSPVADNTTKAGRAQNRRVELQITMAETEGK